jgi:hypothetical protein
VLTGNVKEKGYCKRIFGLQGEMERQQEARQALPFGRKKFACSIYIIFTILHYYNTPKNLGAVRVSFVKNPKTIFLHNTHLFYKRRLTL